jgi:hypothetical protein
MTIADPNNTPSESRSRGARVGRAAAWFTAGALGATALTGVAMAATSDTDSSEDNAQAQTEGQRGPGGMGGPSGHGRHHGGPGGPMLHGQGVIEDQDGNYKDVATQKGEVTAVGDTSINVVSEDGFTSEYVVNDDTGVHKDREDKTIGAINVGDTVHVTATKEGETQTAVRIGALSPEQAAEMEERREQFQNGETTKPGSWSGPSAGAETA